MCGSFLNVNNAYNTCLVGPGPLDLAGNERACTLAKEASGLPQSETPVDELQFRRDESTRKTSSELPIRLFDQPNVKEQTHLKIKAELLTFGASNQVRSKLLSATLSRY